MIGPREGLLPGLERAAEDAARLFRLLLDAQSAPGRVVEMAGVRPPPGLGAAVGALLLTLADADTPLWLERERRDAPVADWLRFHANLPFAETRAQAVFALGAWETLMPLADWAQGTPDYPDRSASLIVEVASLTGGPEIEIVAPGLVAPTRITPALPVSARGVLAENAGRFPLGVDLYFTAGASLMALPRSVRPVPQRGIA